MVRPFISIVVGVFKRLLNLPKMTKRLLSDFSQDMAKHDCVLV